MLSNDPTEAGEQLERFAQSLQQKAQRYNDLQQQLNAATVTERSANGEVTVTIDANGVLTNLELSERTRGMEPAAVAAQVMGCLRQAQAKLREQVSSLVHDTVGDDAAGANIAGQYAERFPYPVEEDRADAGPREMSLGGLGDGSADRTEPQPPRRRPRPVDDDDEDLGGGSILR